MATTKPTTAAPSPPPSERSGSQGWDQVQGSRTEGCSIEATLSVISDRWTLLILRNVFRGVRRFAQMQSDLDIAKNILSDRLNKLVANGVLEKIPYQERPTRYEYHLTAKGIDLSPALIALMGWGDRWYKDGEPPTVLVHEACGHPIALEIQCHHCNVSLRPHQIRSQPGSHLEDPS